MIIPERRLSEKEITDLSRPLVNDLTAYFRLLSDAALDLFDKAVAEGWTPEQTIDELDRMIAGDNRAPETVAAPEVEDVKVNKSRLLTLQVLQKSLETLLVVRKSKKWVSTHETGSHLLVDGKGNVLAGAGGALTKKPDEKKDSGKKEPASKKKPGTKGEKLDIDFSPITDEIKDTAQWIENLPTQAGS